MPDGKTSWNALIAIYWDSYPDTGFWDWLKESSPEGLDPGINVEGALKGWWGEWTEYQKPPTRELPTGEELPDKVTLPSGVTIGVNWIQDSGLAYGLEEDTVIYIPVIPLEQLRMDDAAYIMREAYGADYSGMSFYDLYEAMNVASIEQRTAGLSREIREAYPEIDEQLIEWARLRASGNITDEQIEETLARPTWWKERPAPVLPKALRELNAQLQYYQNLARQYTLAGDTISANVIGEQIGLLEQQLKYKKWKKLRGRQLEEARTLTEKGFEETGRIAPITGGFEPPQRLEAIRAGVEPGIVRLTEAQKQQALTGFKPMSEAQKERAIETSAREAAPPRKRKKPPKTMTEAEMAQKIQWERLVESSKKPQRVVKI